MNLCRLAILILALLPRTSLAKILDYSESSWAVTVQAHGAWMGAGNSIYGLDVPGDFTWDGGMDGAWGLEPGLFFHSGKFSLHLGFLYLTPMSTSEVKGATKTDATKSLVLNLKHSIYLPQAHFQLDLVQKSASRIYLGAGAGWATLKARHSYELSPALAADWSADRIEQKFESQAIAKTVLLGAERWFGQDTALAFEAGYRDLFFRDLKYSLPTELPDGARSAGDPLKRAGHKVGINYGGAFASLVIKTYIRMF